MAVPGEDTCRLVAPCMGLPTSEPNSQHVDQAYAGGNSDGSVARPWLTIQEAVDAAASGALVLVAAGSYVGEVRISGKTVRLWGSCPSEVTIDGDSNVGVAVISGADATEIHNLAVTGGSAGVVVSGASGVLLDSLWVHDTGNFGVAFEASLGAADGTVRNVLVERASRRGVSVTESTAVLEAIAVRDVRTQGASTGWGVVATPGMGRANMTVRGSLVERVTQLGIGAQASDLVVEGSVVVDVAGAVNDGFSRAIEMQATQVTGGNLTVRGCLVERANDAGVLVFGSSGHIENTVSRGNLPDALGRRGAGFTIENDWVFGHRGAGSIINSVADWNTGSGAIVIGSDVSIEGLLVRDTLPAPSGDYGRGIGIEEDPATGDTANVSVSACQIERCIEVGIAVLGSQTTIDNVRVIDTRARADGLFGDGISVFAPIAAAAATVRGSLVEGAVRAGISSFGATLDLGTTDLFCNAIDLNGSALGDNPFSFVDAGENRCGCEADESECKLQAAELEPPQAL